MGALSKKLRSFATKDGAKSGIGHYCPGCKCRHVIYTKNPGGPTWSWDGNVDAPTVTPSVRSFVTDDEDEHGNPLATPVEHTLCHYVLTAGVLNYCGDCGGHGLSGQQVPLPDWPDDYGGLED